jgi:cyclopropane-fatty-acyl-phospholipid synthase
MVDALAAFFLSVEELFAYSDGGQWWVSHYRFERR